MTETTIRFLREPVVQLDVENADYIRDRGRVAVLSVWHRLVFHVDTADGGYAGVTLYLAGHSFSISWGGRGR